MTWWRRPRPPVEVVLVDRLAAPLPAPDPAPPASREQRLAAAFSTVGRGAGNVLLIAGASWVVAWLVGKLWVVVLPVLLGLLLTTFLAPLTQLLRRWTGPTVAASLTMVAGLGALAGLVAVLVPQIRSQSKPLADSVVAGLETLREKAAGPPFHLDQSRLDAFVDQVTVKLQSNAQDIADGVWTGVTTASSLFLNGLLAVILAFFFLKDGPRFLPWVSGLVGTRAAPHVSEVCTRTWAAMGGFMRSQAAVGAVDAIAIGIGLAVLGVPLAVPLAVLVFFGGFIPIIGGLATGALAALVALVTQGPTSAVIVVILVVVVQQVEGNVLQPILVGRTLELHAAVVMLAVTAGGSLFGIVGAFLAVPVVASVTAALRYARDQLDAGETPPASPG